MHFLFTVELFKRSPSESQEAIRWEEAGWVHNNHGKGTAWCQLSAAHRSLFIFTRPLTQSDRFSSILPQPVCLSQSCYSSPTWCVFEISLTGSLSSLQPVRTTKSTFPSLLSVGLGRAPSHARASFNIQDAVWNDYNRQPWGFKIQLQALLPQGLQPSW